MSSFTPRQREIIAHLARGAKAQQVADTLGISVETIQTHIKRIYRKLEIHNRVELVQWVMRNWGADSAE